MEKDNKDFLRLIMHCKEILIALDKYEDEKTATEDMIGDIQANVSDIMYLATQIVDYKVIGDLVYHV